MQKYPVCAQVLFQAESVFFAPLPAFGCALAGGFSCSIRLWLASEQHGFRCEGQAVFLRPNAWDFNCLLGCACDPAAFIALGNMAAVSRSMVFTSYKSYASEAGPLPA
jgi:hypothetical protein